MQAYLYAETFWYDKDLDCTGADELRGQVASPFIPSCLF